MEEQLGSEPSESEGLFLATITVTVPLRVRPITVGPEREKLALNGAAAWEARTALGYILGEDIMQEVYQAGNEAILGITGEVSRLERLEPRDDIDPDYTAHRS